MQVLANWLQARPSTMQHDLIWFVSRSFGFHPQFDTAQCVSKTDVLTLAVSMFCSSQWTRRYMNRPCFLLQRALPLADEPDDSPISEGGDASGKRQICLHRAHLVIHTRASNLNCRGSLKLLAKCELFWAALTLSVHRLKVWEGHSKTNYRFLRTSWNPGWNPGAHVGKQQLQLWVIVSLLSTS